MKRHRTSVKEIANRSLDAFRRAIEANKDITLIKNKYRDLERCCQILHEKHEAYAAAIDCANEDMVKENDHRIVDLEDQYDGEKEIGENSLVRRRRKH